MDPSTTFLDPACKSGVFLREIAKRLLKGIEDKIPNLQERIDHIFQKQLFGIAITELTSLISRRSVYCSKYPNSKFSVTKFDTPEGNIRFRKIKHAWRGEKCAFCGASQSEYERDESLETHAYEFIHTTLPETIFNMKFDVIIGNPPYQLSDGGHAQSAIPIYQKFIQKAKKLEPRYLCMITPSRWFTGGRGLDNFREEMLHDNRIRVIHDFLDASDCFPGVEIKGGICYFLWDRDNPGLCKIFSHENNSMISEMERPLLEDDCDTFIRYNEALGIFRKIRSFREQSFADIVSANDPFGYDVRENNSYKRIKPNFSMIPFDDCIEFYYNGWRKDGVGYIGRNTVDKNNDWIDLFKVLIPQAWGIGNARVDWVNPFIAGPNSACTETYIVIGPFQSADTAQNALSYMQTRFFHLLVSLIKISQHATAKAYTFVPIQDFSEAWTDEKLYAKYGLTEEEIAFIESMVRPMDLNGETTDE